MSSYPPDQFQDYGTEDQGGAGLGADVPTGYSGGDGSRLPGPHGVVGDVFKHILGVIAPRAMERGMRLKAMADDIRFRREAQQRQREQWKMNLEDRRRKQQLDDLNTHLALRSIGGIETTEPAGLESALTTAMGPTTPESTRTRVSIPYSTGSKDYYLPSEQEDVQRGTRASRVAAATKGAEAAATERGKLQVEAEFDPYVDIKDEQGNVVGQAKKSKSLEAWEKVYKTRHPNMQIKSAINDKGDMTFTGIVPATGEIKDLGTKKGVGKTKTVKPKAQSISSGAMSALRFAQKLIDKANSTSEDEKLGTPTKPGDPQLAQKRWAAARAAVQQALKAYPNELTGGIGDPDEAVFGKGAKGGYAHIDVKPKDEQTESSGGTEGPDTQEPDSDTDDTTEDSGDQASLEGGGTPTMTQHDRSGQTLQGHSIRRENIAQAAKIKGLSPNQFAQQWQQAGGEIV